MPIARRALLLLVLVVALVGCDTPAEAPSATATPPPPRPATPTPTATPTPGGPDTEAVREGLRGIAQRVSELRELDGGEDDLTHLVPSSELAARIAEALEEPDAIASIEADERLYRLLGLIEQNANLHDIYRDLLGEQVAGMYRPDTGELFVRADREGLSPMVRVIYAHEYAHYLQDRHFDLEAMTAAVRGNRDRALATQALIEGDAVLVQQDYMLEALAMQEALALLLESVSVSQQAAGAPTIVRHQLEFPYVQGLRFAAAVRERGGNAALDAAFADPPRSTSQVLHPDRYFEGIEPVPVELPALEDALGSGWSRIHDGTLGEFFLRTWVVSLGVRQSTASEVAASWTGDSYAVLEGPDDRAAFVASITWSNGGAAAGAGFADTLAAALDEARQFEPRSGADPTGGMRTWDGPGGVFGLARAPSGSTAIAVAPSVSQVQALIAALLEA